DSLILNGSTLLHLGNGMSNPPSLSGPSAPQNMLEHTTDWDQALIDAILRNDLDDAWNAYSYATQFEPVVMAAVTSQAVHIDTLDHLERMCDARWGPAVDWNEALTRATGAGLVDKMMWLMECRGATDLSGMYSAAEKNGRWHIVRM